MGDFHSIIAKKKTKKVLKNKNKNQNGLKKQKIDRGLNFIFKIMLNRQI